MTADLITPAQLAAEMSDDRYTITRAWVINRMKAGDIPHIKVGRRYWTTRELLARLDQTPEPTPASRWGRP